MQERGNEARVRPGTAAGPSATDTAWSALLGAARLAAPRAGGYRPRDTTGSLAACEARDALIAWRPGAGWEPGTAADPLQRDLLELYLPVCGACARPPLVIGHLGQSLDGFIATGSGDSCFVTGEANLTHLHRMRALCDAVIVGAGTARCDDPRLTTRRVPGPHPLRVVLDPRGELSPELGVFGDGAAATLWVHGQGRRPQGAPGIERLPVACGDDGLDLRQLCDALAARGLSRLFVEGGGVTVSAFLAADCLHRLQVAVAPLLIGDGRPGVRVAAAEPLARATRPHRRIFRLGEDLLYDFDLGAEVAQAPPSQGVVRVL